jgi:hypothetical protein
MPEPTPISPFIRYEQTLMGVFYQASEQQAIALVFGGRSQGPTVNQLFKRAES